MWSDDELLLAARNDLPCLGCGSHGHATTRPVCPVARSVLPAAVAARHDAGPDGPQHDAVDPDADGP